MEWTTVKSTQVLQSNWEVETLLGWTARDRDVTKQKEAVRPLNRKQADNTILLWTQATFHEKKRKKRAEPRIQMVEPETQSLFPNFECWGTSNICQAGFHKSSGPVTPFYLSFPLFWLERLQLLLYVCPTISCWEGWRQMLSTVVSQVHNWRVTCALAAVIGRSLKPFIHT